LKTDIKQAVLLCGGLGTRLRPITNSTPKPMVLVNGLPFLHHLLRQLSEQGIRNFLLLTGYLEDQIKGYFKDGSKWNWKITYSNGPIEWDTGRRLWEATGQLDKDFLLLYSDNFATFNINKLLNFHNKNKSSLTLSIAKKELGNININNKGKVLDYDQERVKSNLNYVEIGYMIANKSSLLSSFNKPDTSLSEVIKDMVKAKKVRGYLVKDGYHSVSDPIRLKKTEHHLKPKKILLLDRDGVINKRASKGDYVRTWKDFKLVKETLEALKSLSKLGFSFIVISNQAGVSRGMIKEKDLNEITSQMTKSLAAESINLLKTYICTHHWKDNCNCRKPETALFNQASEEFSFRLDNAIYIGDDVRDCQAAFNANCISFFIGEKSELSSLRKEELPDKVFGNLIEAVPLINKYYDQVEQVN